jgi:hypothetical protein
VIQARRTRGQRPAVRRGSCGCDFTRNWAPSLSWPGAAGRYWGGRRAMSFEQWYLEIPIVTRCYLTASVLTTAACYFDIISPFSLYLNYRLIFEKYEFWRILTNFFFFGMPSLDFVFHMYFLVRYCRLLEEVSAAERRRRRGAAHDGVASVACGRRERVVCMGASYRQKHPVHVCVLRARPGEVLMETEAVPGFLASRAPPSAGGQRTFSSCSCSAPPSCSPSLLSAR